MLILLIFLTDLSESCSMLRYVYIAADKMEIKQVIQYVMHLS